MGFFLTTPSDRPHRHNVKAAINFPLVTALPKEASPVRSVLAGTAQRQPCQKEESFSKMMLCVPGFWDLVLRYFSSFQNPWGKISWNSFVAINPKTAWWRISLFPAFWKKKWKKKLLSSAINNCEIKSFNFNCNSTDIYWTATIGSRLWGCNSL